MGKTKIKIAIIDSSDTWYAQPKQIFNELMNLGHDVLWMAKPWQEKFLTRNDEIPNGYQSVCIANNLSPNFKPENHPPLKRAIQSTADFIFVGDKSIYNEYFSERKNAFYMPYAVNTDVFRPMGIEETHEIGFVGFIKSERRKQILEMISKYFNLSIKNGIYFEEVNKALNEAKILFNNSDFNEINMRVFESLAAGKLLITDRVKYLEELFTDGEHLVYYDNPKEIIKKIDYYLKNNSERKKIAQKGCEEVQKNHSYKNRAEFIIEKISLSQKQEENQFEAIGTTESKIFGLTRVRNEAKIIKETLDHLAEFCTGGIIVYDDASTDDTVKICKSYSAVLDVVEGKIWDKNRENAEFQNRAILLKKAKEFSSPNDWFVYIDADERIEFDWNILEQLPQDVLAVRMKLFDFYITEEDKDLNYKERKWLGPEYREIIMAFKNSPFLSFNSPDQREVTLGQNGKIFESGFVKHYGKAISVQQWEDTCDYYANHFPKYAKKWILRKGKAIHSVSDFGYSLITWQEIEQKGIKLTQQIKKESQSGVTNNIPRKKLNILVANHHLSGYTGSEILTLTLAQQLKLRGHNVIVYSKYIGEIGKEFIQSGVRLANNLNSIKDEKFDIAHVHHNISIIEIRNTFNKLPIVFFSQGVLPFLEQPPIFEMNISMYLALSDEIKNNMVQSGVPRKRIEIIENMVNVENFMVKRKANSIPKKALVISGRIDSPKESIIREACKIAKVDVEFIGGRFGEVKQDIVINKINASDIVFSLGRGAIEGMIAGRCVIIFDYQGADGIITTNSYAEIKKNNFSGRRYSKNFDVNDLAQEISKYNINEILEVQKKAINDFSSVNVTKKLEEIYIDILKSKNNFEISSDFKLTGFINNIITETMNYSYTKGLEYAISLRKDEISEVISMAEKFITKENYESAVQILKMYLLDNPNNIDALNDLAVVSILTNKYENALTFINQVLKIDSANEIALENFKYLTENFNQNEEVH